MGKREKVALLSLSCWRLVVAVWLFLLVPWVCLQFVIVVFPDHTHLLFFRGNSGPDPLEKQKAIKPAFNVGPLIITGPPMMARFYRS